MMNIAMWSGPRNLSTALMYAFGNRADFRIVDEPFYAAYLQMTGLQHPMRQEILASQNQDPEQVALTLCGSNKAENTHFYQKHMTQHMIEGVPRDWMASVENVFLIRHPARVVASFAAKYENPSLTDIGFQQQAELFDHAVSLGQTPIVVDSAEIRRDPRGHLGKLCNALGLSFSDSMLSWERGGHKDDGVWAAHWYRSVHESTGFAGAEGPLPKLDSKSLKLADQAMPFYEHLKAKCL